MKKCTLFLFLSFIPLTTWSQEISFGLTLETNVLPLFYVPAPIASMIGIEHDLSKTNKRWALIHGLFYNYRNGDGNAFGIMNKMVLGNQQKKHSFEGALGIVSAFRWNKSEGIDGIDFESKKFVVFPVLDLMYKRRFQENRAYFKVGISSWIYPIYQYCIKNDFINSNQYDGPIFRPSFLLGFGYKI